MLSETDAAWLAGYIDGDGCICLTRTPPRKYRTVVLVIDSADQEILAHVQKIAGGYLVTKTKTIAHHRQCWSWRLKGMHNIRALLMSVLPYLRCAVKRERARMIVEEWSDCTPRNGFYTPEIAAKKEKFEMAFMAIGAGRGKRSIENIAV